MSKLIVRGYRPHRGQQKLHHWIATSPNKRNWCIITPRQWGKTTFLLNESLRILLNEPGAYLWYVTPYIKQTANIFKTKLLPALGKIDSRFIEYLNRSTYEIKFKNGSMWQFQSAENYEGLRSATLDYLICDEFAFFRQEAYNLALSPMLAARGKRAYFVSTPRGKNQFHEFYQMGELGSNTYHPDWASFRGNYLETGNLGLLEYKESMRLILPPDVFRQEYEAEFIDAAGKVFKNLDRIFNMSDFAQPTSKNFVGIDLGQEHDRTVVTILNERGECCYHERFELKHQQDSTILIGRITELLKRFPGIQGLVETNFNKAIYDHLYKVHRKLFKWHTTNENKNELVSGLILAIDEGGIKLPTCHTTEALREELLNYEMNFSKIQRKVTFSAPPGAYDDCVISLMLALRAYKTLNSSGNWNVKGGGR